MHIRNFISKENEKTSDDLFVWIDGNAKSKSPSKSPSNNLFSSNFIKTVLGHSQITSLTKYAIIKMMQASIPENLIIEMTGQGENEVLNCREIILKNTDYKGLLENNIRSSNHYTFL